jgi:hypothetical protein
MARCLTLLLLSTLTALAQTPPTLPRLYAVRLSSGPAWDAAKSPNDQTGMKEHSANVARLRREGTLVHGALRADLDAYNRHAPDAVATFLAPNVKWLSLDAGKLSVDGDGREALRTWLAGHCKSQPDVRSDFLSIEQTGALLSVRERASWTAPDGTRRSQQAHAIYEIRDGLIVCAWYFPAVSDVERPAVRDPAPAAK